MEAAPARAGSTRPWCGGGGAHSADQASSTALEQDPQGFLWRKYGEKTVGARKTAVKRSYYRCMCHKAHNPCFAKKRVDRLASAGLDEDPLSVAFISSHNHASPKNRDTEGSCGRAPLSNEALLLSEGLENLSPDKLAREIYKDLVIHMREAAAAHADELPSACPGSECRCGQDGRVLNEDLCLPLDSGSTISSEVEDILHTLLQDDPSSLDWEGLLPGSLPASPLQTPSGQRHGFISRDVAALDAAGRPDFQHPVTSLPPRSLLGSPLEAPAAQKHGCFFPDSATPFATGRSDFQNPVTGGAGGSPTVQGSFRARADSSFIFPEQLTPLAAGRGQKARSTTVDGEDVESVVRKLRQELQGRGWVKGPANGDAGIYLVKLIPEEEASADPELPQLNTLDWNFETLFGIPD